MNHALATLIVVTPMLTACLNDEPRIVQVPAAPNYSVAPIQTEEPRVVQVISATPNYRENQVPQQQCHTESVPVEYEEQVPTTQEVPNDEPRRQSVGGAVLGGLLGAGVGRQIGHGHGRQAATILGLIGGAVAGGHMGGETPPATRTVTVMQTEKRTRYEQQEKCETVNETSREVESYTVTFNYRGQPVTTVMPYNPGPNLVLGMAGNGGR
jgi:uncharacterized protein YcfJ